VCTRTPEVAMLAPDRANLSDERHKFFLHRYFEASVFEVSQVIGVFRAAQKNSDDSLNYKHDRPAISKFLSVVIRLKRDG